MQYEYDIKRIEFTGYKELLVILNDLGKEGWIINSIERVEIEHNVSISDITCMREVNYDRVVAMTWWNDMELEEQFYKTIKYNYLIQGDKTRHPSSLTGSEVELIYKEYTNE